MPDLGPNKTTAVSYPPESLYQSWCSEADSRNMSTSQFIIQMVETGRKDISLDAAAGDSMRELLQEQASLKREIDRQRTRIQDLERQLEGTSQSAIVAYIETNPGATSAEIIQHVADTIPGRVAGHLDALEGTAIRHQDTGYYPIQTDE